VLLINFFLLVPESLCLRKLLIDPLFQVGLVEGWRANTIEFACKLVGARPLRARLTIVDFVRLFEFSRHFSERIPKDCLAFALVNVIFKSHFLVILFAEAVLVLRVEFVAQGAVFGPIHCESVKCVFRADQLIFFLNLLLCVDDKCCLLLLEKGHVDVLVYPRASKVERVPAEGAAGRRLIAAEFVRAVLALVVETRLTHAGLAVVNALISEVDACSQVFHALIHDESCVV